MKEYFYFTYGTDGEFPFYGGWSEVIAENRRDAIEIFRKAHPDRKNGAWNFAFVYDDLSFSTTGMKERGNMGRYCHETLG